MSTVGQAVGGIVGGVVGFFVGGPTGALYGAQIGMMAGGYLDPPKGPVMKGPRLSDLTVQTSTYGAPLPRLYGQIATYGNVIWLENNRIKEVVRKTTQGGKGGGGTTTIKNYEYYATFAVSLSDTTRTGPASAVKRIWIAGRLFYNAGSNDRETISASNRASKLFRFYTGSETQMPDPRMEADIGVGLCPAHRGVCYIVFYDLPLATYGNSLLGAQIKAEIVDSATQELSIVEVDIVNANGQSGVTGDNTPLVLVGSGFGSNFGAHFYNRYSGLVSTSSTTKYWTCGYDKYRRLFVAPRTESSNYDLYNGDTGSFVGTVPGDVSRPSSGLPKVGNGLMVILNSNAPTSSGISLAVYAYATDTLELLYDAEIFSGDHTGEVYNLKYPQSFYINDQLVVFIKKKVFSFGYGSYSLLYEYTGGDSTSTITGAIYDGSDLYISVSDAAGARIARVDSGVLTTMFSLPSGTHLCDYDFGSDTFVTTRSVYNRDGTIEFTFYTETREDSPAAAIAVDGFAFFPKSDQVIPPYEPMLLVAPYYSSSDADLEAIVENECVQSSVLTLADIDASDLDQDVRGYRVTDTGSIRAALEPLQGAWPFDVVQRGYSVAFVRRGGSSVATIPATDLDARAGDDSPGVQLSISNEMDTQLPRRVQVRYIDATREYDIAEQAQEKTATESISVRDLELAIVLNANEAAGMSEVLLHMYWLERRDVGFRLPPSYRGLEPADVITITGEWGEYQLRLTQVHLLSDGRLECTAKYNSAALYTPTAEGAEGNPPDNTVPLDGPSLYALLDIPLLVDENNIPGWPAAMAGYSSSWPGGLIYRSVDNGQTWSSLQAFSTPVTMGFARDSIGEGRTDIVDTMNRLQVDLMSGELSSISIESLLNGGNILAYGAPGRWEICSPRLCELQADGSYILSDWLRGRFGTEWVMDTHQAGDAIVLMVDPDVIFVAMPSSAIGAEFSYRGITAGASIDSDTSRELTYDAVNLKPLSPVYLNGNRHPVSEDWTLSWIRRGRISPEWRDNIDVPVGEASESYEIEIYEDDTFATVKRTLSSTTASVTYTEAQQTEDFGESQSILNVRIYQMSATVGRGYPLTGTIESASAWTPANLVPTSAFWVNESSPITLVSGAVSQINDLSGNNRHFGQSTSANRPTTSDLNGLRTLLFDGTNDNLSMLSGYGSVFKNVAAGWTFALYRTGVTDGSITERPLMMAANNAGVSRVFLGAAGGGSSAANRPIQGGRQLDAEAFTGFTHASAMAEQWVMALGINTYSARTVDLYVNGSYSGGLTGAFTSSGNTSNTDSTAIRIGSNIVESTHYNGQIAELLSGNTALSTDDIDRIFGYCAWKFDLVDLLPPGHPYKNQRPSV
jgi:hypothetical protein